MDFFNFLYPEHFDRSRTHVIMIRSPKRFPQKNIVNNMLNNPALSV